MTHCRPALLLSALALLLPGTPGRAAAPPPDFGNLPAYLRALNASHDAAAKAIRREIADGPASLARERALCAKVGLPTTLAQLNQPLPPASKNAAPLYVQWDTLRKAKPLHLPRFAGSTWPMSSHLAYTSAQDAEVRALFAARPDYTGLLDQATDRPRCVFATDWTKYPDISLFTETSGLREVARTYEARSYLLSKEGRFADAVTIQARGFAVAWHAADSDPDDVGFLVASAIDNITTDGMTGVLQLAGPNAAANTQVQTALAAAPHFSFGASMRGDGAIADGTLARLRRISPAKFVGVFYPDTPLSGNPASAEARFTPAEQRTVDALCDAAEARTLAELRGLRAAARLPRAARNAAFVRLFAESKNTGDDPVRLLSAAVNPMVTLASISGISGKTLGDRMDAVPARHGVLAAAAAVLAAKAQTGAFPETLPVGFTDPYTGKPLGYRREGGDGFVVYSVGPDGKDTGGVPGDRPKWEQAVFRYPAPPPRPLPADALK